MRGTSAIIGLTGLFLLASDTQRGQVPTSPEFEVASVKAHRGPVTVSGLSISGTVIRETAVDLMDLVIDAYNLRNEQVSGAPDWAKGGRYDIQAKAPGASEPTPEQVRPMLQSLLADRFKLIMRHETTEAPAYRLVLARAGAKLNLSNDPTGVRSWPTDTGRHIEGSVTMEFLARLLSKPAGRPVMDQTGLVGSFSIALEWTPEGFTPPDDTAFLPIFTAVQEQLGLKLESTKAPVEKLIIEHAEKPDTDN